MEIEGMSCQELVTGSLVWCNTCGLTLQVINHGEAVEGVLEALPACDCTGDTLICCGAPMGREIIEDFDNAILTLSFQEIFAITIEALSRSQFTTTMHKFPHKTGVGSTPVHK